MIEIQDNIDQIEQNEDPIIVEGKKYIKKDGKYYFIGNVKDEPKASVTAPKEFTIPTNVPKELYGISDNQTKTSEPKKTTPATNKIAQAASKNTGQNIAKALENTTSAADNAVNESKFTGMSSDDIMATMKPNFKQVPNFDANTKSEQNLPNENTNDVNTNNDEKSNDPIGALTKSDRDYLANRYKSSSVIDNGGFHYYQKPINDETPLKQSETSKANQIVSAQRNIKDVEENAFPTISDAKEWVTNFKGDEEGNQTLRVAKEVLDDAAKTEQSFLNNGYDFTKGALQYVANGNSQLAKSAQSILADDLKLDDFTKGQILNEYLNSRYFKETKDPTLKKAVEFAKRKASIDYPSMYYKSLREKISQDLENEGENNWFYNPHGTNKTDAAVERLEKKGLLTKEESYAYRNGLRGLISIGADVLETPGVLENFGKTLGNQIKSTINFIPDLISPIWGGDSKGTLERERLRMQETPSEPHYSDFHNYSKAFGGLLGFVAPMMAGSGILQAVGAGKNATNLLVSGMNFFHDIYKTEQLKHPDNNKLAYLSSIIQTALWAKGTEVFSKAIDIKSILGETKPQIDKILESLQNGKIQNAKASQNITEILAKRIYNASAKAFPETLHVKGIETLNQVVSGVLDGDFDVKSKINHSVEDLPMFFLTLMPLKLMGASGVDLTKDYLREMVKNPNVVLPKIKDPESRKNYIDLLKLEEFLKEHKPNMKDKDKDEYRLLYLKGKLMEEQKKNSPDASISEIIEKNIAENERRKKEALTAEDDVDFLRELYDNDLLDGASKMALTNEAGKFNELGVDDYFKTIAQQANGLGSDWKPVEGGIPTMENVREDIKNIANKMFAKEISQNKKSETTPVSFTTAKTGDKIFHNGNESEVIGRGKQKDESKTPVVFVKDKEGNVSMLTEEQWNNETSEKQSEKGEEKQDETVRFTYDTMDDVPSKLKNRVREENGKFVLDMPKVEADELQQRIKEGKEPEMELMDGDILSNKKQKNKEDSSVKEDEVSDDELDDWVDNNQDKAGKLYKQSKGDRDEFVRLVEEEVKKEKQQQQKEEQKEEQKSPIVEKNVTPVKIGGVEVIDSNGELTNHIPDNIKDLKEKGDNEGLNKIYTTVKILLNGVAQSKGEKVVKALEEVKTDLENYLKKDNSKPKITQDGNEQKLAESKLSDKDNNEQESDVKDIESKAESDNEAELNEAVKKANESIKKNTGVVDIPISEIKTDTKKYQNRIAPFSEKSANKVATKYDENKFDPIVVYKHPDGNIYVLSGHSRFEGMKRRNAETIPARFFEGTPKEAEEFAKKSNKFNDLNSEIESASYYRKMRENGSSEYAIEKEAKEQEQQGAAKRVVAFSHLNPKGKALQELYALQENESDDNAAITRIAQKVGEIRKQNPHLTDAHENELFDHFLKDTDNIPTDKEIGNQDSQLNRSIAAVRFDNKKPLNLQKFTAKSDARVQWEKEKTELEKQISNLRKEILPNKTTGWSGLKEKAIALLSKGKDKESIDQAEKDFNNNKDNIKDNYEKQLGKKKEELKAIQDKLAKHILQEKNIIEGDRAQTTMFSATDKPQEATLEQQKSAGKILDFLQRTISYFKGGKNIVLDAKEFAEGVKEATNKLQYKGEVYGFVKDGKMYLDQSKLTNELLGEELTHLNQQGLRLAAENGNKQAKRIVDAWDKATDKAADAFIKGAQGREISEAARDLLNLLGIKGSEMSSDVYKQQKGESDAAYKTRLQDELWAKAQKKEFAVHLDKLASENKLTAVTRQIYEALKDFYRYVVNSFKGGEDLSKLSLSELIDRTNKELSGGKWLKGLEKGKNADGEIRTMTIGGKQVKVRTIAADVVDGFYSPIENAVHGLKQEKGTATQMLQMIKQGKGVKADELQWTGVEEWLKGKGNERVTKQEILDYMKDNRVKLVEVVKSEAKSFKGTVKSGWNEIANEKYGKNYDDLDVEKKADVERIFDYRYSDDSKFSLYQLGGKKENYIEVLVTLPKKEGKNQLSEKDFYVDKVEYDNGDVRYFANSPNARSNGKKTRLEAEIELEKQKRIYQGISKSQNEEAINFKSSHFDEPNILVHLRMNTRTDANGNKVLFLEEVQSDWGQKGKKEGFDGKKAKDAKTISVSETPENIIDEGTSRQKNNYVVFADGVRIGLVHGTNKEDALSNAKKRIFENPDAVIISGRGTPPAPFVMDTNAWTKLGLKVALKEAVAQGIDKIAWTTGEQQNDRYDLSKQVDEIKVLPQYSGSGMTYAVQGYKNGEMFASHSANSVKELEGIIGKELAQKVADKGEYEGELSFKGSDLQVGGSGMKGFYGSQTKTIELKSLPLINEKGEINDAELTKQAKSIIGGDSVFNRFSPQEQRGFAEGGTNNVEASILLSASEGAGGKDNTTPKAQENRIEDYAKSKGIWTDNTTQALSDKYGEPIASEEEAIVWHDPKTGKVIKSQDTFQYENLQQKLDGITLHNAHFPESAIKVLGFGRNAKGEFQIIIEQPHIQGEKLTASEIKNHLEKIGFKEDENGHFSKGNTIIEDVHTGNAIKTPEGNIVVIDPIMRLNTKEQGYGGIRESDNSISTKGNTGFVGKAFKEAVRDITGEKNVKIGETKIDAGKDGEKTQHSIDITPEMREAVGEGIPMFSAGGGNKRNIKEGGKLDNFFKNEKGKDDKKELNNSGNGGNDTGGKDIDSDDSGAGGKKKKTFNTFRLRPITERENKIIKNLGEYYDVENVIVAKQEAKKLIDEIGIEAAFNAAREDKIKGGVQSYIFSEAYKEAKMKLLDEKLTEDERDDVAAAMQEIIDTINKEQLQGGRAANMWGHIYNNDSFIYNADKFRNDYKEKNGHDMPKELYDKLSKLETTITEKNKQISDLEEKIKKSEEQSLLDNIANNDKGDKDIKDKKKKNILHSLSEKIKANLKVKPLKITLENGEEVTVKQNSIIPYNELVELVAKVLDKGGDVLQHISEYVNDKFKNYSTKDRDSIIGGIHDYIKDNDLIEDSIDGNSTITRSGLAKVVQEGFNKNGKENYTMDMFIDDVRKTFPDYADFDNRTLRDIISDYGKTFEHNKDDVNDKLREFKTDMKLLSALEDAEMGQMPKRSGLVQDAPTPLQRRLRKKINEFLKKIPKTQEQIDKLWKTSLQSIETRLDNLISDLEQEISTGEKIVKTKNNVVLTDEILRKKEIVKRLREQRDEILGSTEKTPEEKVKEYENALRKRIGDIRARIDYIRNNKDIQKTQKERPTSQTIDLLKDEIKTAKEALKEVQDQIGITELHKVQMAKKALQKSIDNYNDRIKNNDFDTHPKGIDHADNADLQKARLERLKAMEEFDAAKSKNEWENKKIWEKGLKYLEDIYDLPKLLKASFDLAAPLRQGFSYTGTKEWKRAYGKMLKFAKSEKAFDNSISELKASPDYYIMKELGLKLADGDFVDDRFNVDKMMQKIPIVGHIHAASERAYSGFLNELAVEVFRKKYNGMLAEGYDIKNDLKPFKEMAEVINNSLGRGKTTTSKGVNKALSKVFFSPSMLFSRFRLLSDAFNKKNSVETRKFAQKRLASIILGDLAISALVNFGYGAIFGDDDKKGLSAGVNKLEKMFNPTRTDFGQISLGDGVYIDLGTGYNQMARTAGRVIAGKKVTAEGRETELTGSRQGKMTPFDEVTSFAKNKMSPSFGTIFNGILLRKNPVDPMKPLNTTDPLELAASLFSPISVGNIAQIADDKSLQNWRAISATLGDIFGLSSNVYSSNKGYDIEGNKLLEYFKSKTAMPILNKDFEIKVEGDKYKLEDYPKNIQEQYVKEVKNVFMMQLNDIKSGNPLFKDANGGIFLDEGGISEKRVPINFEKLKRSERQVAMVKIMRRAESEARNYLLSEPPIKPQKNKN